MAWYEWAPDTPGGSPDRLDALVWAFSELMSEPEEQTYYLYYEDDVCISPF